ncbi:hypothetical protein MJO29_005774 [Puccinia striiformis f. sp. tritici]|uniref:DNA replication regulator Sld3 C-terminal domain-containing protein n=1 Tax=Puccinia striiformis f. sp. tritici PST-78 TaxID=1165861 RepID=A0A0L0URV9_9BASI|nr:hypothetical protein Pst134EB_010979 [Puccinia striiformis f. sp. tritici]KAI7960706.1 hypothetical protein MJO29_005774 [Puccinia striiformis f. sp. tritici]KNE89832.1 hypothetical protein PSTG_16731 [Puccinia striiformis f. sp. tritici PST-78]
MTEYTLRPSFDCPFGWPTQPNYPIDSNTTPSITTKETTKQSDGVLDTWNSLFPSTSSDEQSLHQEEPDLDQLATLLTKLYLESVYLPQPISPSTKESSLERFVARLRKTSSLSDEENHSLLDLYQSFLISEDSLDRKWSAEVPKIAKFYHDNSSDQSVGNQQEIDVEDQDEIFHRNEDLVLAFILNQFFDSNNTSSSSSSISFIKPDSISQQIEIWSIRETQLQIVLLLELIILTNLSLDSGSQLLHKKKRLLASPSKRKKQKKEEIDADDDDDDEVVADLECLLEGLVDKLAMWQIISSLENNNLASIRNGLDTETPLDLDLVQKFWIDVIEEHYTSQLPLLNPSFRPKLFPTSIYDPSASSSLLPTQFDSTNTVSRSKSRAIDRTPNLKKLERKKVAQLDRQITEKARLNLSPTMAQLTGNNKRISRCSSINESINLSANLKASKSLFNRRQVIMSNPSTNNNSNPSKALSRSTSSTLFITNQSSLSNPTSTSRSVSNPRIIATGSKRKQSIPKHKSSTSLLLSTPRKSIKTSSFLDFNSSNNNNTHVLVPDTPQTNKK